MKKFIFFFISVYAFGQNKAIDTMMANGSQPATILKLNQHKIYMAQNKELVTPYIIQKNGSFVSAGVPDLQVSIIKSKIGTPKEFIGYTFETDKLKGSETKEIIDSDGRSVYIKKSENGNRLIVEALYPLEKDLLIVHSSIRFSSEDEKLKRFYEIREILQNGVMILEDYYKYRPL